MRGTPKLFKWHECVYRQVCLFLRHVAEDAGHGGFRVGQVSAEGTADGLTLRGRVIQSGVWRLGKLKTIYYNKVVFPSIINARAADFAASLSWVSSFMHTSEQFIPTVV